MILNRFVVVHSRTLGAVTVDEDTSTETNEEEEEDTDNKDANTDTRVTTTTRVSGDRAVTTEPARLAVASTKIITSTVLLALRRAITTDIKVYSGIKGSSFIIVDDNVVFTFTSISVSNLDRGVVVGGDRGTVVEISVGGTSTVLNEESGVNAALFMSADTNDDISGSSSNNIRDTESKDRVGESRDGNVDGDVVLKSVVVNSTVRSGAVTTFT